MNHKLHYVLAGVITKDILPDGGHTIGGTTFYGGTQAARLGTNVTVITTLATDLDLSPLQNVQLHIQPSPESATFENIYDNAGKRIQYLHARPTPLNPKNVPQIKPDILHLAPLIDEVPLDFYRAFPESKIYVTPQGWMRRIQDNQVFPQKFQQAENLLPHTTACVFSEEDVGFDEREIHRLAEFCPVTVCTRNGRGADLFINGKPNRIPVKNVEIIDATGAGDVFAAAFFIGLHESNDPEKAVHFAHAAAARSITGKGIDRIGTRAEILAFKADQSGL